MNLTKPDADGDVRAPPFSNVYGRGALRNRAVEARLVVLVAFAAVPRKLRVRA